MDKLLLTSIKYILQPILNQIVTNRPLFLLAVIIALSSCSSTQLRQTNKKIQLAFEDEKYNNQFTGLLVVDAQTKDTIIAKNSAKYFIPASTTKLFTLYAAIKVLPEKIPSLKYVESKDSIYIEGTGDPSWLHPYFKDTIALDFLRKTDKTIVLHLTNFDDEKYGPGWAWEDYQYYFSPELGPIPLYGNVVTLYEANTLAVSPTEFTSSIKRAETNKLRALTKNEFSVPKILKDTIQIPFITSPELTKKFLQQKLNKEVLVAQNFNNKSKNILYGIPTDSIYKRMLYESDNFLAEQLLFVVSSTLSDTLSFNTAKKHVLENYLSDLKQPPRWVDGSGLSRYNLFTPESMVVVLQKLYNEVDKKSLFKLLPAWDNNGTVVKPKPMDKHFIFGKSGSMGNTYNLSGYLKTKSGKVLFFSFMNNHHMRSSKEVRNSIYSTLLEIHETY
uniref:D-alanyl-D-alanine carboxypeptidase n=1 Tax=uncultured Croceitalea sp. TaxID=1798908 RepID=UPI003305DA44